MMSNSKFNPNDTSTQLLYDYYDANERNKNKHLQNFQAERSSQVTYTNVDASQEKHNWS